MISDGASASDDERESVAEMLERLRRGKRLHPAVADANVVADAVESLCDRVARLPRRNELNGSSKKFVADAGEVPGSLDMLAKSRDERDRLREETTAHHRAIAEGIRALQQHARQLEVRPAVEPLGVKGLRRAAQLARKAQSGHSLQSPSMSPREAMLAVKTELKVVRELQTKVAATSSPEHAPRGAPRVPTL